MCAEEIARLDLEALFPVRTQTTGADRAFLLGMCELLGETRVAFDYIEIGSFLGGSLVPFLRDRRCRRIVSVDDRGRKQPDERGATYDYTEITAQTMLDQLHANGIDTAKLETFDGSIDALPPRATKFDLGFIDGEHTDEACFRDFLWLLPHMKSDGVVLLHDSTLVHRALKLILLYLRKEGRLHIVHKMPSSEMTGIFFGLEDATLRERYLGPPDDLWAFFARAEADLLRAQVKNRVEIAFNPDGVADVRINPLKDFKGY